MRKLVLKDFIIMSRIWQKLEVDVSKIEEDKRTYDHIVALVLANMGKAENEIYELIESINGKRKASRMSFVQVSKFIIEFLQLPDVEAFFLTLIK